VSAFRASGNMLIAMIIAMVSQWMIQFPLAYVLSKLRCCMHKDCGGRFL
jgi:Na+-driven multidrug efflux pump